MNATEATSHNKNIDAQSARPVDIFAALTLSESAQLRDLFCDAMHQLTKTVTVFGHGETLPQQTAAWETELEIFRLLNELLDSRATRLGVL